MWRSLKLISLHLYLPISPLSPFLYHPSIGLNLYPYLSRHLTHSLSPYLLLCLLYLSQSISPLSLPISISPYLLPLSPLSFLYLPVSLDISLTLNLPISPLCVLYFFLSVSCLYLSVPSHLSQSLFLLSFSPYNSYISYLSPLSFPLPYR